MNRRLAAVLSPAFALPALVAGVGIAALPGAAGAATPSSPSTPQPSPSSLSLVIPLPSPLPALNLLTTGQPAATNPLAGLFPAETETIPQMQAALLADVISERAAAGLGPVVTNSWAQSVAMGHSQDMANARNIWHNYTGYVDVAKQAIDAYVDGENVGMAETLVQVNAALMASPSHKANILYPLFNTIGIGVAQDADGYVYVTEDFADIRPATAPVVDKPATTTGARPAAADAVQTAAAAGNPGVAGGYPLAGAPAAASPIVVPTPPPSLSSVASPAAAPMRAIAASGGAHAPATPGTRLAAVAVAMLLVVVAAPTALRRRAHTRTPGGHR